MLCFFLSFVFSLMRFCTVYHFQGGLGLDFRHHLDLLSQIQISICYFEATAFECWPDSFLLCHVQSCLLKMFSSLEAYHHNTILDLNDYHITLNTLFISYVPPSLFTIKSALNIGDVVDNLDLDLVLFANFSRNVQKILDLSKRENLTQAYLMCRNPSRVQFTTVLDLDLDLESSLGLGLDQVCRLVQHRQADLRSSNQALEHLTSYLDMHEDPQAYASISSYILDLVVGRQLLFDIIIFY